MNINDLIKPGYPVIDIGAHIGDKTQEYLDLGASIVIAVEMQASLSEKLIQRFAGKPVIVIQAAVSDQTGDLLQIHSPGKDSTIATITQHWQTGRFKDSAWKKQGKVPTITLDGLCGLLDRNPSFVKVDVEGAEKLVACGMKKCNPEAICFEYTSEFIYHVNDIAEQLGTSRYLFAHTIGESKTTVDEPTVWDVFWNNIVWKTQRDDWGSFYAMKRNYD